MIEHAIDTNFLVVSPYDKVSKYKNEIFEYRHIVVKEKGRFLGVLSKNDFIRTNKILIGDYLYPKPVIDISEGVNNIKGDILKLKKNSIPAFINNKFHGIYDKQLAQLISSLSSNPQHIVNKAVEANHRIKNNLLFLISFLSLKVSEISDTDGAQVIKDCIAKLYQISDLHKFLYKNGTENLHANLILEEMINNYTTFLDDLTSRKIKLSVKSGEFLMTVDQIYDICSVLFELMTNSLKHCDNNQKSIEIKIKVNQKFKTNLEIIYFEKLGFLNPINFDESNSFGKEIIKSFIEKYDGNFSITNKNGLQVKIYLQNFWPN